MHNAAGVMTHGQEDDVYKRRPHGPDHANQCRLDRGGSPVGLDGRPVSVMEWLSAHARAR